MLVESSEHIDSADFMVTLFRALGDPNRLAILGILRRRCGDGCEVSETRVEQTVSEIAAQLEIGLSTISHHLKELRRAGLIHCERRGQRVHCSINVAALDRAAAFLGDDR